MECISRAADQSAIIKCIAPEHLADCIENDLTTYTVNNSCEYNLLFEGEPNQIMECLHSLGNYLQGIVHILRNCAKIGPILGKKLAEKTKICKLLCDFMPSLSTMRIHSHTERTNWCKIKSKFAFNLFTFVFDVYDEAVFLETLADISTSIQSVKTFNDQCIVAHLIEFIVSSKLVIAK